MKSELTLNNPLWKSPQRRAMLSRTVLQSAAELESRIKRKILDSRPAGRVYGRGKRRFHRASARGQAPAVDTGGLLNSIRARKIGLLKAVVATSKIYAARLDDQNRLNRPFFQSEADAFRPKFKQNLLDAIKRK